MDKGIIKALQVKVNNNNIYEVMVERELTLLEDILAKHPDIKREWLKAMDDDSEHKRLERKSQDSYDQLLQTMNKANIDINDDGTVVLR